jgi:fibro-slime domain-containing protein
MSSRIQARPINFVGYALLASIVTGSLLLPREIAPSPVRADDPPSEIRLPGIVRDFRRSHADFDIVPDGGYGHSAGNVGLVLDGAGLPIFVGAAGSTPSGEAGARMDWGSYVGNGFDNRAFTGLGFAPDLVIVKGDGDVPAFVRTSTMAADRAKNLAAAANVVPNHIQSLDPDGFTIGSSGDVNEDDKSYFWVAFEAAADAFAVGTYTGDATAGRIIGGPGFRPDFVMVIPEINRLATVWSSAMVAGTSMPLDDGGAVANRVTGSSAAGFQIGDAPEVNTTGRVYHYAAWRALPEFMAVGAHVGTGAPTAVAGTGVMPDFVIIKADDVVSGAHRSRALCGDDTARFEAASNLPGGIEQLTDDGFTLGTADEVNAAGRTYYWATFGGRDAIPALAEFTGFKVLAEWRDESGNAISPHMYGVGDGPVGAGVTDFDLSGQILVPETDYAVQVTVLGSALFTGDYHRPVTMRVTAGTDTFDPFGPFDQAIAGNLNDDQSTTGWANPGPNPRTDVLPAVFPGGTPLTITGRSWAMIDENFGGEEPWNWETHIEADAADATIQLKVLRDGDPVPSIPGIYGQDDADSYVANYADPCTGLMTMADNQVIYLFELGVNGGAAAADFQDLVVLVTLASAMGGFGDGGSQDACGNDLNDGPGVAGPASDGGVSSKISFGHWFSDVMGQNLSLPHEIVLTDNGSGVYEYLSDAFHPIDDRLFGNEGDDHNWFLTFAFTATFEYDACAGQFFEFEGTDDAWAFVDAIKVLDIGGILPGTGQRIDMDRAGLVDGSLCTFSFFYAQRQDQQAVFRVRTNIPFVGQPGSGLASGGYD